MSDLLSKEMFAGKVAFIAGGTSGINLGIAERFAAQGVKLAVISRSKDKVESAVTELRGLGTTALGYAADVRDFGEVEGALKTTHAELGDIDYLISGAAGNFVAPALGISANGFKTVVDIDLLGTFNVLRAAHRFLKQPGASIINITAPQSVHPYPMQAHVCAAKAGIDMLTRTLALEWGPHGIRVNAISPGPISDTEGMSRLAPTDKEKAMILAGVPLGRYGDKAEIGDAALFLCSPMAQYITGVILPVDGGLDLIGAGPMARAMDSALEHAKNLATGKGAR